MKHAYYAKLEDGRLLTGHPIDCTTPDRIEWLLDFALHRYPKLDVTLWDCEVGHTQDEMYIKPVRLITSIADEVRRVYETI